MKSWTTPGIWVASVALAVFAGGAAIGIVVADDAATVADLQAQVADLSARIDEVTAGEARLRAERNRLEAQLAASADAAVCPTEYASTADSGLPLPFAVEHPCGWHVVVDAVSLVERPAREGLIATVTLISQLPVALAPSGGALADIELTDWSDDPADGKDPTPTVQEWLADERATFEGRPREDRFEGPRGITIHRLRGRLATEGSSTQAVVLVWTYVDPLRGDRHIIRALAEEPGARVTAALMHLARSFTPVDR